MRFTVLVPNPGTRSSISRGARFTSTGNCSRLFSAQASLGSISSARLPGPATWLLTRLVDRPQLAKFGMVNVPERLIGSNKPPCLPVTVSVMGLLVRQFLPTRLMRPLPVAETSLMWRLTFWVCTILCVFGSIVPTALPTGSCEIVAMAICSLPSFTGILKSLSMMSELRSPFSTWRVEKVKPVVVEDCPDFLIVVVADVS